MTSFDEINDEGSGRLRFVSLDRTRKVGQQAFFAYMSANDEICIAERLELGERLRGEFALHRERVHLRRAIAEFLNDARLIRTSEAEISAWQSSFRMRRALRQTLRRDKEVFAERPIHETSQSSAEEGLELVRKNWENVKLSLHQNEALINRLTDNYSAFQRKYQSALYEYASLAVEQSFSYSLGLINAKSAAEVYELNVVNLRARADHLLELFEALKTINDPLTDPEAQAANESPSSRT